jgi:tetratricopeptide (TPR) repeat protein
MSARRLARLREASERFACGDFGAAERICSEILEADAGHPDALHILGVVRLAQGDAAQAAALLARAVERDRGDAVKFENLALAHLALGEHTRAETALREALALGARSASLFMRLALALAPQGKNAQAEQAFKAALGVAPHDPHVLLNLGNFLAGQGRREEAIEHYRRALEVRPDYADACFNLGLVLKELGRLDEAVHAYRRLLSLAPDHAEAWNNLGIVHEHNDEWEQAAECYRRALALAPESAAVHCNLCSVYRMQGRFEEAEAHGRRALEIRPDFVEALMNLASLRVRQGRFEEGRAWYAKAREVDPQHHELHLNYGTLCLGLGDFDEGWPGYRWRPSRARALAAGYGLDAELPERVAGQTALVLGEQGLGDELFFLRFALLLRNRRLRVICQSDRRLKPMLERGGDFEKVIAPEEPLPRCDFTFLSGDLPLVLMRAGEATRTPPALRLQPLADRVEAMRGRLAALGAPPYVGLTWRAGTAPAGPSGGRERVLYKEAPLEMLAQTVSQVPGTLLGLQRHPRSGEFDILCRVSGRDVHDLSALNDDLEGMLALLFLVDEYVGVSNTNMHLRAGLGRTARVLIPFPAEWRWMHEGGASPWFPGFPLYRQKADGDWSEAFGRLQSDLAASLSLARGREKETGR